MGDVIELGAERPHLAVRCEQGTLHEFPVLWIEHMIEGHPVPPLPGCLLRAILRAWLERQHDG